MGDVHAISRAGYAPQALTCDALMEYANVSRDDVAPMQCSMRMSGGMGSRALM